MAPYLSEAAKKTLMSSFILSRLDYCNSLLINLPSESIDKLHRLQNNAAKMTLRKSKRDHVKPILVHLHWLPLKARICYKIALLCHKCLNSKAPSYLSAHAVKYVPFRPLRSGDKSLLVIPKIKTKRFGERSFSHAAPTIWNSPPQHLREITQENKFKNALKSHLFKCHLLDVL